MTTSPDTVYASTDDFMAALERDHRASMCTPSEYTVTGLKQMNTYDGVAWTATLRRNGKAIAHAENDGHGGCNFYRFTDRDAETAFRLEAEARFPSQTFEQMDAFIEDLCSAAEFASAKHGAAFITDDQTVTGGEFFQTPKGMTTFQVAQAVLNSPDYRDKNPLVFDKEQRIFRAAVEIVSF